MTAEIAVMNCQGVALAADSVTSLVSKHIVEKTYSVNKRFPLRADLPVEVMSYNLSTIDGMRLESIFAWFAKHDRNQYSRHKIDGCKECD